MFTQLVTGLTTVSYTALSLNPGTTYQFKVKAKNIKDALIKSVKDFYDVRDYPSKNSIRLDIRVVEE